MGSQKYNLIGDGNPCYKGAILTVMFVTSNTWKAHLCASLLSSF